MLKYLFTAQFNDGAILEQAQEDVSKTNPKKSAFFDVLNDTRKLTKFWITGHKRKYLVDLEDGHFEIDGVPFCIHEQTVDPSKELSDFRLVYFRRVQQSINIDGKGASTKIMFAIGWQANYPDGKNVKQIIFIK